jgi:hypothetical protein
MSKTAVKRREGKRKELLTLWLILGTVLLGVLLRLENNYLVYGV